MQYSCTQAEAGASAPTCLHVVSVWTLVLYASQKWLVQGLGKFAILVCIPMTTQPQWRRRAADPAPLPACLAQGLGKRVAMSRIRTQARGGRGIRVIRLNPGGNPKHQTFTPITPHLPRCRGWASAWP